MAAGKRRVFDLTPGASAPKVIKPPARTFAVAAPIGPVYLDLPEPYDIGQRVEVGGGSVGQVFNVQPCSCLGLNSRGYVYVVELDVMRWGSWYYFGHSPEIRPI